MRDDDVRASCFAALDVLQAQYGPELPYTALAQGFNFRGRRIPFLNRAYGIYRASIQRGPAALSINSAFAQKRYQDTGTENGVEYRYQDGPIDNHFNASLREAHRLGVPLTYFIGTRPNWYVAQYPAFVEDDLPGERTVVISFGEMRGPFEEREPFQIENPIERRYVVRRVKQRIHQAQFRGAVLPAYEDRCAVCTLKEVRLLDAAHITADAAEEGEPLVSNGLSLCSIHHRAFDEDLVGISPDYEVNVSSRLLDDEDGPMLEVLKEFHGRAIVVPRRHAWRPERERLAIRFDRFLASSTEAGSSA
jgi:putative restriction endonuclease